MDDAPRPARPIRILVLLLAIASLALVMCTRSQPPATPINKSGPNAAAATPDAGAPPPAYFPATKAAGPIYPQQQAQH